MKYIILIVVMLSLFLAGCTEMEKEPIFCTMESLIQTDV